MPTKTPARRITPKKVAPKNDDGRVQLQFRLTTELRDRLRKEADRRDVSVNFLIERALDEGLIKWQKEKLRS